MATERRTVVITVQDKASQQLGKIEKSARRTATATERLQKSFTQFNRVVSVIAGGAILTRAVGNLFRMVDGLRELQGRVRLVIDESQSLNEVWDDIEGVARRTGTSIESVATGYARLGRAAQKNNIDHEQLTTVVESLAATFRISGSTAQETANSLIQLSQGLNAGALRGDEFRSVSEANIKLLQLLEEEFKDTGLALKDLAAEGAITSEVLFKVLTENSQELKEELKDLPLTLSRAFQKLRTVWAGVLLDAENSVGVLQTLAQAIDLLAQSVEAINNGFKVLQSYLFTTGVNEFNTLLAEQLDLREEIARVQKRIADEQSKPFGSQLIVQTQTKILEGYTKQLEELDNKINEIRARNEKAAGLGREPPPLTPPPPKFPPPEETIREEPPKLETLKPIAQEQPVELFSETIARANAEIAQLSVAEEVATVTHQQYIAALDSGVITQDQYLTKLQQIYPEIELVTEATKESAKETETWADSLATAVGNVLTQAVTSASDAIYDFAFRGENSFKELANSVAESVAKMILQFALLRAVTGGIRAFSPDLGTSLFGPAEAKGGVYDGGIKRMAKGGIVRQPTVFAMAGGMGLMGEAGPEAIMPLTRGADGKLGVKGGGTTVNVINNTGEPVETEVSNGPNGEELVNLIIGRVTADIATGGRINKTISQAYGLRRQGVPR